MEGEEEEDNNIMLIKMLAKAQCPENLHVQNINRKQSNVSTEERAPKKDSPQPPNPLFT
jgi:hypothetical protein